jgi:hypothetical protein
VYIQRLSLGGGSPSPRSANFWYRPFDCRGFATMKHRIGSIEWCRANAPVRSFETVVQHWLAGLTSRARARLSVAVRKCKLDEQERRNEHNT